MEDNFIGGLMMSYSPLFEERRSLKGYVRSSSRDL